MNRSSRQQSINVGHSPIPNRNDWDSLSYIAKCSKKGVGEVKEARIKQSHRNVLETIQRW